MWSAFQVNETFTQSQGEDQAGKASQTTIPTASETSARASRRPDRRKIANTSGVTTGRSTLPS